MSMGCGMMPMMFPGVQQYLPPPMGMGIGMGMGMGMEMGMNRPMMQFPNLLAGSNLPMQAGAAAAAAAHLGQRFPLPAFAMPPVPGSNPSQAQAMNNQPDPIVNPAGTQNTTPPPVSGFPDSYQQFLSSNQVQFHIAQAVQVSFFDSHLHFVYKFSMFLKLVGIKISTKCHCQPCAEPRS